MQLKVGDDCFNTLRLFGGSGPTRRASRPHYVGRDELPDGGDLSRQKELILYLSIYRYNEHYQYAPQRRYPTPLRFGDGVASR